MKSFRSFFRSWPWVGGIALAMAVAVVGGRLAERSQSVGPETTPELFLKELIAKDLPQLDTAALDDSTRVTLLRQWAYENTDWSTPGANLDDDPAFGFYERQAPELFNAFRNDRGGVLCGGTAYAFMRLCQLYGYYALTVDMGARGVATHVVTLVRLSHRGRDVWSVQDPTFDVTYTHRDGTPFDYLDLLRALRDRQDDRILVKEGQGRSREFIVAPDDPGSMLTMPSADESFERLAGRLPDGALKYRRRYSIDRFNEIYGSHTAEFLTREGHPEEAIYLFLYPIRISGGRELDRRPDRVPRQIRPHFVMNRAREIVSEARR